MRNQKRVSLCPHILWHWNGWCYTFLYTHYKQKKTHILQSYTVDCFTQAEEGARNARNVARFYFLVFIPMFKNIERQQLETDNGYAGWQISQTRRNVSFRCNTNNILGRQFILFSCFRYLLWRHHWLFSMEKANCRRYELVTLPNNFTEWFYCCTTVLREIAIHITNALHMRIRWGDWIAVN